MRRPNFSQELNFLALELLDQLGNSSPTQQQINEAESTLAHLAKLAKRRGHQTKCDPRQINLLTQHILDQSAKNDGRNRQAYSLGVKYPNVFLTDREGECTYWLLQGHTYKMIATEMNISSRTVECHLQKIRLKLDCHNKRALLRKLRDSDFLANFIADNPDDKRF